ncbi:hypothetical protein BDV09DRAFT_159994 [Aspergillus tetrazonus]
MRGLAAFAFSFPLLRGDPPPVSTRAEVCSSSVRYLHQRGWTEDTPACGQEWMSEFQTKSARYVRYWSPTGRTTGVIRGPYERPMGRCTEQSTYSVRSTKSLERTANQGASKTPGRRDDHKNASQASSTHSSASELAGVHQRCGEAGDSSSIFSLKQATSTHFSRLSPFGPV